MRILIYNCQGIGGNLTVSSLMEKIEPRSKEETLGLKGVLLDIHLLGVIDDKRKEYKNGWTGGLPMIIGYDFSPPQKISIGWLKGLIMLCFVLIHMRPRGGRKGILHMIRDGEACGCRAAVFERWLCIDELRLELLAQYQNDIFDYGKVKELEFKLQKALVGKVKELEFKFKISHIFREGNHRVDALANHSVQGSSFTWKDTATSFILSSSLGLAGHA
ncbi:unnamed protein product [Prunus armeniaca]